MAGCDNAAKTHNVLLVLPILAILGKSGIWLVEASYLPQLWKLYRIKEAHEFSFLFPGLNVAGRLAGVGVAIQTNNAFLAWFFVVGICLRLILLGQVIYYRRRAKRTHLD